MVTKPAKKTIAYLSGNAVEVDDHSIAYPTEDGERLAETEAQYVPLTESVSALRNRLHQGRTDVYVIGNMLVYYRMNDTTVRVAPDVFVVFGVDGNHPRDSWFVWREGKAPDFVIEVASRSTRARDRLEKRDIYARMGVTEYWRFNPNPTRNAPALIGERLSGGEYQPIPVAVDNAGILRGYSELLGLDLCVLVGPELRLYDPVSDQWLLNHRESEAARLAAEAALSQAEAARAAEITARQQAEAARAAEAAARQQAEAARAAETTARQQAEARIRELEAQMRSLGFPTDDG